jgi:quercetin dioxygenase-like cupin family protein
VADSRAEEEASGGTARSPAPSPFRRLGGRAPYAIFPGVGVHSVGGDQVLLCRVSYEPGATVPRHAHEHTEQVMVIVEGDLTVSVDGTTERLGAGDAVVVNRGLEHELRSEAGCTFFEALAPVPLDHVEDPARDLVLGPERGTGHVER